MTPSSPSSHYAPRRSTKSRKSPRFSPKVRATIDSPITKLQGQDSDIMCRGHKATPCIIATTPLTIPRRSSVRRGGLTKMSSRQVFTDIKTTYARNACSTLGGCCNYISSVAGKLMYMQAYPSIALHPWRFQGAVRPSSSTPARSSDADPSK